MLLFNKVSTTSFSNDTQEQTYKIPGLPLVDFRTEQQDTLSIYLYSDVIFEITRTLPEGLTFLERENRELKRAKKILREASAYFALVAWASNERSEWPAQAAMRPADGNNGPVHRRRA